MGDKRRADIFAAEGSIAGKLRKRREAIEAGDPSGGQLNQERTITDPYIPVVMEKPKRGQS